MGLLILGLISDVGIPHQFSEELGAAAFVLQVSLGKAWYPPFCFNLEILWERNEKNLSRIWPLSHPDIISLSSWICRARYPVSISDTPLVMERIPNDPSNKTQLGHDIGVQVAEYSKVTHTCNNSSQRDSVWQGWPFWNRCTIHSCRLSGLQQREIKGSCLAHISSTCIW